MSDTRAQQGATPADGRVQEALVLLEQALALIDAADVPAEVGARLQHTIDCLQESSPGS